MSSLLDAEDAADFVFHEESVRLAPVDSTTRVTLPTEIASTDHSGLVALWRNGQPVRVTPAQDKPVQIAVKRMMDIILSACAILALAPFFALVAMAIKLTSSGPVFFHQQREGLNGRAFGVFKFRTMKVEECDVSGVAHTTAGDSRVTRVGSFLRRTSIDELPQLINVLRGEMSLVGPRPHVPGMLVNGIPYAQLVGYYNYRHRVLPGITGWAQANGFRGEASGLPAATERVAHDVAYIQNYSLWLDLVILYRTVRREFLTGTGR